MKGEKSSLACHSRCHLIACRQCYIYCLEPTFTASKLHYGQLRWSSEPSVGHRIFCGGGQDATPAKGRESIIGSGSVRDLASVGGTKARFGISYVSSLSGGTLCDAPHNGCQVKQRLAGNSMALV